MEKIPQNQYDLIKQITYEIGSNIIEQFSGKTLEMIATFDRHAQYSVSGKKIVFPLRLCTAARMDKFLPLISLVYHDVKIKFEFRTQVLSKKLHLTCVALDSDERRHFAQNPRDLKLTLKKMHYFSVESTGPPLKIDLPFAKMALRDMIISIIRSSDDDEEDEHEPLIGAKISFKGPNYKGIDRQAFLDGNMLRNVIPKANYGVSESRFYFLQFDPTPLEVEPGGIWDLGKIELVKIRLHLILIPGKYKIEILTRSYNMLRVKSGYGTLHQLEVGTRPVGQ
jgi:hypothetical protein